MTALLGLVVFILAMLQLQRMLRAAARGTRHAADRGAMRFGRWYSGIRFRREARAVKRKEGERMLQAETASKLAEIVQELMSENAALRARVETAAPRDASSGGQWYSRSQQSD